MLGYCQHGGNVSGQLVSLVSGAAALYQIHAFEKNQK